LPKWNTYFHLPYYIDWIIQAMYVTHICYVDNGKFVEKTNSSKNFSAFKDLKKLSIHFLQLKKRAIL